jgi:hypothetical protein
MTLFISCCEITYDTETYYVNEKFLLIDKTQKEMVVEGNTKNVRTWVVQRVVVENDSVMTAEIDDRGCGCGIITDEKWNNRNIGDTLFFEYILKERFILNKIVPVVIDEPLVTQSSTIESFDVLELDRLIREKESEILENERELERLLFQKNNN